MSWQRKVIVVSWSLLAVMGLRFSGKKGIKGGGLLSCLFFFLPFGGLEFVVFKMSMGSFNFCTILLETSASKVV